MSDRVVQSWRYRYFVGERGDPPSHCPLCGRLLEQWSWANVEKTHVYPSLVCYNGKGRLRTWLCRKLSITSPTGTHYEAEMPSYERRFEDSPFDPHTGLPRN
jgi:hypothetical protein